MQFPWIIIFLCLTNQYATHNLFTFNAFYAPLLQFHRLSRIAFRHCAHIVSPYWQPLINRICIWDLRRAKHSPIYLHIHICIHLLTHKFTQCIINKFAYSTQALTHYINSSAYKQHLLVCVCVYVCICTNSPSFPLCKHTFPSFPLSTRPYLIASFKLTWINELVCVCKYAPTL